MGLAQAWCDFNKKEKNEGFITIYMYEINHFNVNIGPYIYDLERNLII